MLMNVILNILLVHFRDCIYYVPFSVRRFIISLSTVIPLKVTRLILHWVTTPIGSEKQWIKKIKEKTWKGVWIASNLYNLNHTESVASNDLVILYMHGGGFSWGHASMYMETFQLIINHLREEHQIRASILSVDYSLSPENVWPRAINESMDAYRYLIHNLGFNQSKVIFAGDSAGGNLVASMLLTIKKQISSKDASLPYPAAAALLSPWIDLTPNQPSFFVSRNYDLLGTKHVAQFVSAYIPNYNQLDNDAKHAMINNPLISPIHGEFKGTCPLFIAYGGKELLRESIETFISNLKQEGCDLTVLKGENALHIWLVFNLMASSKRVYQKDCKSFIDWIASVKP